VYYEKGLAKISPEDLIELPPVDRYLPTEEGEPPLARAKKEDWKVFHGEHMEYNTMPGWAGSSWCYLRYMDPHNEKEFCSKEKSDYWGQVDLYMGGAEHATGHLLYSRFWCKILFDLGYIGFDEPFKKMINQGMIQGKSSMVYRLKDSNTFISKGLLEGKEVVELHAEVSMVHNDILDTEAFKKWRPEFKDAEFILEGDSYICGSEVEKMSKSKYNVINPDALCEEYGADTLRCYEMFLGPIEQHKPWDTNGISGVHNFLRKVTRLFGGVKEEKPTPDNLRSLHKTIKKLSDDLDRYSFNTPVSALMICVNELLDQNCTAKEVFKSFTVLLSPYAPHLAEELWESLDEKESVTQAAWPKYEAAYIKEDSIDYPVSFNGKMRFKMSLSADLSPKEVEEAVLSSESAAKYLEGKAPKKVIVVPKRIVNIVI